MPKFWYFHFSAKNRWFSAKKPIFTDFGWKSVIFHWKMKISKFWHLTLFWIRAIFSLKSAIFCHFYIGLYIRKVRFSDIPGRTRMAVESRHAIIFSFFHSVKSFDKSDASRFTGIIPENDPKNFPYPPPPPREYFKEVSIETETIFA